MVDLAAEDAPRAIAWLRRWPQGARLLVADDDVDEDADELLCDVCGKWFSTLTGLHQHAAMVHREFAATARARQSVTGSVCPVCGGDFRSRVRLIRRLVHGAAACVAACAKGLLPRLDPQRIAEADQHDCQARAKRRKAGLRDHDGLPFVAHEPAPRWTDAV